MNIVSAATRVVEGGRPDYFTGAVKLDPIALNPAPSRLRAFRVSFAPGARTAWHAHPLGQVLHILSGVGRVQSAGGPVRLVRPGDTVWFAPGERHWHGATSDQPMEHLAMQEADDSGSHSTWFEHVSDADYNGI